MVEPDPADSWTLTKVSDGSTNIDSYTINKESTTDPATYDIMFYLQFDNPATESTEPDRDAVYTVARQTVTYDNTNTDSNPVSGSMAWDSDILIDLVPDADYSIDTTDDADDDNCPDQADLPGDWEQVDLTENSGNMCIESWSIGNKGYSCVKVKGRMKRSMTPTEKACDISFDYQEYDIKIAIGTRDDFDGTASKFSATVNFDQFNAQTGATSVSMMAAFLAGVTALAF